MATANLCHKSESVNVQVLSEANEKGKKKQLLCLT